MIYDLQQLFKALASKSNSIALAILAAKRAMTSEVATHNLWQMKSFPLYGYIAKAIELNFEAKASKSGPRRAALEERPSKSGPRRAM